MAQLRSALNASSRVLQAKRADSGVKITPHLLYYK